MSNHTFLTDIDGSHEDEEIEVSIEFDFFPPAEAVYSGSNMCPEQVAEIEICSVTLKDGSDVDFSLIEDSLQEKCFDHMEEIHEGL